MAWVIKSVIPEQWELAGRWVWLRFNRRWREACKVIKRLQVWSQASRPTTRMSARGWNGLLGNLPSGFWSGLCFAASKHTLKDYGEKNNNSYVFFSKTFFYGTSECPNSCAYREKRSVHILPNIIFCLCSGLEWHKGEYMINFLAKIPFKQDLLVCVRQMYTV